MINVDKAYSVLIKNSNRYWINKHRGLVYRQRRSVNQYYTELTCGPSPCLSDWKGWAKSWETGHYTVGHYNRSNASYLAIEIHRWRSVRQSFDPRDQRIRSCDLYNLWTSGFIFMAHDLKTGPALLTRAEPIMFPWDPPATSLFSVFRLVTSWEKTSLLIEWMKCFPTTRAVCSAPQFSVRFQTLKILPLSLLRFWYLNINL